MTWSVYILECADGSLYCGATTDVNRRLSQHNSGTGAKYTRGRTPCKIVYVEDGFDGRGPAQSREYYIKSLSRKAKLEIISNAKYQG